MKLIEKKEARNSYRFASIIIDFILYSILFFTLTLFVGNSLVNLITSYDKNYDDINSYYLSSSLLVLDSNNNLDDIDTNDNNKILKTLEYYYLNFKLQDDKFDELNLDKKYQLSSPEKFNYFISINNEQIDYKFYWFNTHVLKINDDLKLYNDLSEPEPYFIYKENKNEIGVLNNIFLDSENNIKAEYKKEINDFLINQYNEAFNDLYNSNFIKDLRNKNINAEKIELLIFSIVPYFFIYVLPTLINKTRKTIGRYIMKVSIVDFNDSHLSIIKNLFRSAPFIFLTIVNCVFNDLFIFIFSWILFLLVDLSLTLFSKNKRSVFDLISGSYYIDDRESKWGK